MMVLLFDDYLDDGDFQYHRLFIYIKNQYDMLTRYKYDQHYFRIYFSIIEALKLLIKNLNYINKSIF